MIANSGCIPPCNLSDNTAEVKGAMEDPKLESGTDMIINIYNKRSFKVLFDFVLHSLWISHSPKLTAFLTKVVKEDFLVSTVEKSSARIT